MHHSVAANIVELILGGAGAAVLVWYVVSCVRDGRIRTRGRTLRRENNPIGFWFVMAWASALAVVCTVGIIPALTELFGR